MRERLEAYFACWLNKDESNLIHIFSDDIVYTECYGPEYIGKEQILRWFRDWNRKGTVLEWRMKRCVSQNDLFVAEWYFKCEYEGNIDGFDGVTIAVFDEKGQICNLKEYQSQAEHVHPYGS